jgi:hypothetical protein
MALHLIGVTAWESGRIVREPPSIGCMLIQVKPSACQPADAPHDVSRAV